MQRRLALAAFLAVASFLTDRPPFRCRVTEPKLYHERRDRYGHRSTIRCVSRKATVPTTLGKKSHKHEATRNSIFTATMDEE